MSESAKSAAKPVPLARQQRLMQVLLGPAISEKSTMVGDKHNQVVFRVERSATKQDVKAAVELMFDKQVEEATSSTIASSTSAATRTALRPGSSASSTIRTAARTLRCCSMPTANAATSSRPRA